MGSAKFGDVGSFDLICKVEANDPVVAGGWNET
jgi:hypothetical protein